MSGEREQDKAPEVVAGVGGQVPVGGLPDGSDGIRSAADRHFEVEHLRGDLKGRSVRGGVFTVGAQGLRFVLTMTHTAILSRLLTPDEVGVVMMVVALTGFLQIFSDLGLTLATVQRETVTHRQASTLFWVNVALGALLAGVGCAMSPLVVAFYDGKQELLGITIALSCGFVFGGAMAQHKALLSRQMRFRTDAAVTLSSLLVAMIAAIVVAALGGGYWSIVVLMVGQSVVMCVGYWAATRWVPMLPVRGSGVRRMLGFGVDVSISNVVMYIRQNLDKILIGRFVGEAATGSYTRATQILLLPIIQINFPIRAVALPMMSRLSDQPDAMGRAYLRVLRLIGYLTMPMVAVMGALSEELVLLVLGPQWSRSADFFAVLAFAAFVKPVSGSLNWYLMARGRTRRMMWWSVIETVFTCAALFVGVVTYGDMGVAYALAISNVCLRLPELVFQLRDAPIGVLDWLGAVLRPGVVACVALGAVFGSRVLVVGSVHASVVVGVCLVSSAVAVGVATLVIPVLRKDVSEIVDLVRTVRGSRGGVAGGQESS